VLGSWAPGTPGSWASLRPALCFFSQWGAGRRAETGLPAGKGEPGPRDSSQPVRGSRATNSKALMRPISRNPAIGPPTPRASHRLGGQLAHKRKSVGATSLVGRLPASQFPKRRHQRSFCISASRRQRCGVAEQASKKKRTIACTEMIGLAARGWPGPATRCQTVARRSLCFSFFVFAGPEKTCTQRGSRRHLLNQGTGSAKVDDPERRRQGRNSAAAWHSLALSDGLGRPQATPEKAPRAPNSGNKAGLPS
jgi:hypothetical protein